MDTKGKILLIPEKPDLERDAVAGAWLEAGGGVQRLARFWDPPDFNGQAVCLYGGSNFSLVLAQKLSLHLISPADDWLLTIDQGRLKRSVFFGTLGEIPKIGFPIFAKPLIPKIFGAAVYGSAEELAAECKGLEASTLILFSEIVHFATEARAFITCNKILDCHIYEGAGQVHEAERFIREFLMTAKSPPETYVLDVGCIPDRGWAIVEANASWGAGLNGCNAGRVLPAIAAATRALK